MSRRKNDFVEGCVGQLWPLFIIFAPIIYLLNFLLENIGIVLIVALIVGAIIAIVVAANSAAKKRAAAEAERQRNLNIVNATEKKPTLISIPYGNSFSNKEESVVNQQFREYIQKNNAVIEAKAHLDYLTEKETALKALDRTEEAELLRPQINQARTALSQAQSQRKVLESKTNHILHRDSEIKNAFSAFAGRLACAKIDVIGDFLQSPMFKSVPLNGGTALIFTPGYVMHYNPRGNLIKLYPYSNVSISTYISSEIVNGAKQPSDEIEHIGYRYETKDGRRDMRYSYENNPSYTFVYRGSATIRCGQFTYEQKFSNKSLTVAFEKSLKDYLALMTGKYREAAECVLSNDTDFIGAESVSVYMMRKASAEKLRIAAEKAEAEKREQERREREAAAEAKRKEQQRIEEERQREEKRKLDLQKNLTIVDGVLTNWYGSEKHLVLPAEIIQEIGTAFRWKPSLESVEIPEGITSIHANAFHGSSKIKRIVIPATVREIGSEAFTGCTSLTDVKLPAGLKAIPAQLFANCAALETIVIPASVQKIGAGAFKGCHALKRLLLPEGIISIEDGAFDGCSVLKEIIIPSSVKKLGRDVFAGCTSLERITLGGGITKIPDGCFNNHQKLTEVEVSFNLCEIGARAFKNCQKLKALRFVENSSNTAAKGFAFEKLVSNAGRITQNSKTSKVVKIGESAFENCFVLSGMELPQGLTTIGDYAFANCRSITSIKLPDSLISFGKGVFSGCVSLSTVTGAECVDWHKKHTFTGAPWLATQTDDGFIVYESYLEAYVGQSDIVQIPANVHTIGMCAFDGNTSISRVVIPDGVQVIEELAFANCKALNTVHIADSVTRIEDNAFANSYGVVIQCTRGSAASTFRIRNKIAGEYIAKTQPPVSTEKARPAERKKVANGLSDLSDEELRMIMQMRREKLAQQKAERTKPETPVKTEYTLIEYSAEKVSLSLLGDFKKITNNIFNVKYVQGEAADANKKPTEYETFVIDSNGKIISNIIGIITDKRGVDLEHRVTYSLASNVQFKKEDIYFIILRYKGAATNVVMKHPCQIVIEFASDFDF